MMAVQSLRTGRISRAVRLGIAICAVAAGVALPAASPAQMQGGDPTMVGMGRLIRGTVTAISPDKLTVKTEQGEVYQIAINPNTRLNKGRDPVKLADVKVGDGVGAMGEVDQPNKTVHAIFVGVIDAEQVRKARENLGKTYIAGRVTAIDELKLTILRADGVSQIIAVDEDTSFRRGGRGMQMMMNGGAPPATTPPAAAGGESITLADVKVGDSVIGTGSLKNGIFVPSQLGISAPGQGGRRRRDDGTGTAPAAPVGPK